LVFKGVYLKDFKGGKKPKLKGRITWAKWLVQGEGFNAIGGGDPFF